MDLGQTWREIRTAFSASADIIDRADWAYRSDGPEFGRWRSRASSIFDALAVRAGDLLFLHPTTFTLLDQYALDQDGLSRWLGLLRKHNCGYQMDSMIAWETKEDGTRVDLRGGSIANVSHWSAQMAGILEAKCIGLTEARHSKLIIRHFMPEPFAVLEAMRAEIDQLKAAPSNVDKGTPGAKTSSADLRRKKRDEYVLECKKAGVKVTDAQIVRAANPKWTDRNILGKWIRGNRNWDSDDITRRFEKVFRDKPHLKREESAA